LAAGFLLPGFAHFLLYDFSVMGSHNVVEVSVNLIIGFPEQSFVWVLVLIGWPEQIFDFYLYRLVMQWKRS
jgi:hypothetical protein